MATRHVPPGYTPRRYTPPTPAARRRRALAWLGLAVLLCAAAVIYVALPASSLFLPGRQAGDRAHNLTAAIFCLIGALGSLTAAALSAPRLPGRERPLRATPTLREEDLPPGSIHVIPVHPLDRH
jgi:hypothetical protein